ncbi:MAG: metallophosphoesterase [Archangium sp.]|nr:metallophosphoesterase [Archangium sp.]
MSALRLGIFLGLILLSGALTIIALVRLGRRRPLGWIGRAGITLGVLGVLAFAWGLFIEADWLEVTHVTVQTPKWPKTKKFRIAHFSDLHIDRESRALSRLTTEVADAKADLIVFTGDSLNDAGSLKLLRTTLGSMTAARGRVAVRGNHDVYRWHALDLFGGGVATELTRGPIILEDGLLTVCGAAFNAFDALPDCIAGAPKDSFVLLAFHSPDLVEDIDPKPDLYLAGHTHGGQVAIPLYGAMITMSRYDKKYEAGRYEVGKTTLYVNRGIGFEPHFLRVRFASRPELTIIDIEGTASE